MSVRHEGERAIILFVQETRMGALVNGDRAEGNAGFAGRQGALPHVGRGYS